MTEIPTLLLDRVDSTLLEAERQLAAGRTGPLLICAAEQTGGVGRHGRAWSSPPGNLYWTMLLGKSERSVDTGLAFAAGLAVRDAVAGLGVAAERLRLKWPNDVLLDGRKLAGVLVRTNVGRAAATVVGMGVNRATAPAPAIALAEIGPPPDLAALRTAVTRAFLARWQQWHREGLPPLRNAVDACLHGVGAPTRIAFDRDRTVVLDGLIEGLDHSGALKLRIPDGSLRVVTAGDILM